MKNPFVPLFHSINSQLFADPIKPVEKRRLGNLQGLSLAMWLASLNQNPSQCSHSSQCSQSSALKVVITTDQNRLNQLETELRFCGVDAYVFPDWETLTYDELSPHQDIIAERIRLLTNMPTTGVLLLSVQTLMHRVAPKSWLIGQHFDLSVGQVFDLDFQRERLVQAGYHAVDNVFEPGEFAVRGSVMDLFAVGQPFPVRLELFDDEIDSIRFFNPQTQRSLTQTDVDELQQNDPALYANFKTYLSKNLGKIASFKILPAKEMPLESAKETFRANFASAFVHTSARKFELFNDVMQGIAPAGVEYYQPLFFEPDIWQNGSDFFGYLPNNSLFVLDEAFDTALDSFWQQVQTRYNDRRHDITKPIVAPEQLYLTPQIFYEHLQDFAKIIVSETAVAKRAGAINAAFSELPILTVNHKFTEPLQHLLDFLAKQQKPVLIVAETAGRREILTELLQSRALQNKADLVLVDSLEQFLENDTDLPKTAIVQKTATVKLAITVAPIDRGAYLPGELAIISEADLFGRQVLQTRRRRQSDVSDEFLLKSVSELNIGDPVVHIEHGIGRYHGLTVLEIDKQLQEFIHLKYADDASIYVPVSSLQLISRYAGGDKSSVPLHHIGSGKWDKAKQKALAQIHDVAAELLHVQACRDAKVGINFGIDPILYDLFASQFAFEETPDQTNAIEAVIHDMKQNKPMDRLICGDVGFGKTEVAMRAAFIAVQAGYQVAVLVPTTLLAGQHEDNFMDRFADWAVRIESLSRFGTKKQHDKIIHDLAMGNIDIIIGTHRLLQDDIRFAKLGLMIIDEEHRFGVRDKERIKALQSDVDVLSMTATPIPRTLNMALSGMKNMSIIATPPARRLAIKTFVVQKSTSLMKEAILRELLRGGQVYLVHNDVASIERMAQTVQEMLPEARVAIAHGQMKERDLEQVMQNFYHKKHNVLVCTTIIETGIDIPNANTIVINRADKFGLAQLHQLRGRVGRSHHQAYCYLIIPSIKGLTGDAKKRLDAISKANTLGAGFMLAGEDLEIRGAGELLGKQQSGNMQAIGFNLYMDMLHRATKAIKAGKQPNLHMPLSLTSDINLHCSALIPDDYLGDVHQRLLFYKKISNAQNHDELIHVRSEMLDRFGSLPDPVKNLFAIHKLRLMAEALAIDKIDANACVAVLDFSVDTPVDAMTIIGLIQANPSKFKMYGATRLKVFDEQNLANVQKRIEFIKSLLEKLATTV
ncbi:transcription-repair coupling factor [Moraxella macacae 0408225]|uniref:Transcription-repair-coupling factor n=1 Tax=Moraxella macacae 0408225 TaxID=1230338 RepID=L2F655_9GAMM|nr:transcription-repair coupling factor [Moraxella macacae]ELA08512.1 transcription-repair coupling factor [Moraxella macacae 0408225]